MRKAGIFDIDGTIFRSSLLIEVTERLIDRGLFPRSSADEYADTYEKWRDREGSYKDYIDSVIVSFRKHLKGVHYKDFTKVAEEVVSLQRKRVYRYTRDFVLELKRKGYFLLAISHSPKGIVDQFAGELGFDKIYGILYKTDDEERYTGEVLHDDLVYDKAKLLDRAVEKEGLVLEESVGVGDTESDIAFLTKVARPICFNPNRALYEHAKRAGWEVVVERKDVIYHIDV